MEIKSGFLLEDTVLYRNVYITIRFNFIRASTLQAGLREKSRSRVLDASIIVSASATSGNVSYVIIPYYTNVV